MKPTKPSYLNIPKSTNVSNPPTYTDSKYSTRNRPRPSFVYRSLSSVPKTKSISAPKHTSTLVPTKPRESISFRPRTSISGTPVSSSTKAASLNSKLSATQASNSSLSLVYPTTSTPNPISSVLPGSSTSGIPTLSSNIAHSPSTSNHDAATHSLINKLQCERNALIDKVMELTLQLERERRQPPASVTHTPPTAPAVSSRPVGNCSMKIAIFSDSMCRGVADIMRSLLPRVKITSDIKPGAVFAQVVASIPSQCQNFGPDDFIFIHAGTNDFDDSLQPNSTKRFSLPSPLVDLANKTNVVLCSIFLYNGNLTGLSLFRNESVRSTWDPMVRLVNMDLQLIFPELRMNYQWRSVIGKGSLVYIINNMLMDLSFILDLQRLQLKIQTVRFDNRKATTEIGVKSKVITSILNAIRNRLKGLNNWVLNPVTERMNLAILEELRETNIDLYELLGIKHLYSVPNTGQKRGR
ncbi:hypothetical protein M8J76_006618 [Diaphorina citri]|nr:hypothetical protein M8J76_006618 [Diaphorina citri]